ncbi:glycosyltransferase family 4 protein [Prosthecochloris sp. CIB 2401]|uniref:glycosyltransferase family 4 protein n=1 Tax=Prosthecochloris sp. CIB 2401 TaxID=1868325 RepID=UPI00080AA008|nr:glycosyltransferase family 4 protein [Prosthecochloris sp. CIB 2401]ANT65153.1 Putative teichuronic acid biosynthesis glycosyltransferase TuaH [Prosthecochloris sp. CIB 2401]
MKILFLTDNFPPEVNAPATRTYEHCREWVKQGVEVTVITCAPNFPQGKVYDGYRNRLFQREEMDGIQVVRVWSYITANEGFLKRTVDYISFGVSSFIAGLFHDADLVVATSPQFFSAMSGRTLSWIKRKPWVMEVRDLWPESIKHVGGMQDNAVIKYLEWEEKRCYEQAAGIVTVTDSFVREIKEKGIDCDKFAVVKNGANLELFRPRQKNQVLLDAHGLQGKFVVGYIGTHGMAHKLDFIVSCAIQVKHADVHFLFIGNGAEKSNVMAHAESLGCTNVTFLDSVPKDRIAEYLSVTDVALVPLRKTDLFTTVIPSKIFENASMQKPLLLGVDGEARALVEEYGAGLFFEPENEADFLAKLDCLYTDRVEYQQCQEGGARLAKAFDRKRQAAAMLEHLKYFAFQS